MRLLWSHTLALELVGPRLGLGECLHLEFGHGCLGFQALVFGWMWVALGPKFRAGEDSGPPGNGGWE